MLGAIKYNLRNLANPNGRDARQTFWYYVVFVMILRFVAGMAVAIPMMVQMFSTMFESIKNKMPPDALQAQINLQMADRMQGMVWLGMAIALVSGLLLLMALVRRLHDSDHSGWLVLVPALPYAVAVARMPAQIERAIEFMKSIKPGTPPNSLGYLQQQGPEALLIWIPILIAIGIGVLKSTPGPNRFGESPVSF